MGGIPLDRCRIKAQQQVVAVGPYQRDRTFALSFPGLLQGGVQLLGELCGVRELKGGKIPSRRAGGLWLFILTERAIQ